MKERGGRAESTPQDLGERLHTPATINLRGETSTSACACLLNTDSIQPPSFLAVPPIPTRPPPLAVFPFPTSSPPGVVCSASPFQGIPVNFSAPFLFSLHPPPPPVPLQTHMYTHWTHRYTQCIQNVIYTHTHKHTLTLSLSRWGGGGALKKRTY